VGGRQKWKEKEMFSNVKVLESLLRVFIIDQLWVIDMVLMFYHIC